MNRTKIEWTDYTWNPVTGCRRGCPYCYARRLYERWGWSFEPTFHPERLCQPRGLRKPAKIFVCSTGDLFGAWVPDEWIHQVIEVAENCPQHIFQFLTKNPKRLSKFPWANNCWVGTTVTNQADADERIPWLLKVQAPVRFVSHEPLLSAIDMKLHLDHEKALDRAADMMDLNNPGKAFALGLRAMYRPVLEWAIIGAMTGPGAVKPKPKWILGLIDQYRAAGVPIFLKDNLYKEPLGWTKKIQEWPAGKRE